MRLRSTRVLVISTYPILEPVHGGQKRAAAIFDFYKSKCREAKYVGVFHRGQYPDYSPDDCPLGDSKLISEIDKNPHATEIICGRAINEDIHVRSALAKLLLEFGPNIIHVEQPFPYIGLKILIAELGIKCVLVYGSQNIEYKMKEKIFKDLNIPNHSWRWIVKDCKALEEEFSKKCDLLMAVNSNDQIAHEEMGARSVVVIKNGITMVRASNSSVDYWRSYKRDNKLKSLVVFVGSGHPPNWIGFKKMVGLDTSFLPKTVKLVVAGGVSEYFKQETGAKTTNAKLWSRLEVVGHVSEQKLAGLLKEAEVIILPIGNEEGSNLKTAEAIASKKKIVANEYAFRGYETYRNLPNVFEANNQREFRDTILKALNSRIRKYTQQDEQLIGGVLWPARLYPLEKRLRITLLRSTLKSTTDSMARNLKRVKRKLT